MLIGYALLSILGGQFDFASKTLTDREGFPITIISPATVETSSVLAPILRASDTQVSTIMRSQCSDQSSQQTTIIATLANPAIPVWMYQASFTRIPHVRQRAHRFQ
jgi:hypothetical protein